MAFDIALRDNGASTFDISLSAGVGSYEIIIDAGTYAKTGTAIDFLRAYDFPIDAGTYSQTGTNIELNRGFTFDFDSGVFNITGTSSIVVDNWTDTLTPCIPTALTLVSLFLAEL